MHGFAAAVLVCLSVLPSRSGLRLQTQPLTSMGFVSETYPTGHNVLWQEDVYLGLSPNESMNLFSAVVVLTAERLNAFVVPNTPSCRPASFDMLVMMKERCSNPEDFKCMYRRDPFSILERVTLVAYWDRVHQNPDAGKIVTIKHEDEQEEDVEFQDGIFYLVHDAATDQLPIGNSSLCAYPEPVASIAVSSITTRKNHTAIGPCLIIAGCSDDPCPERFVWHVCSMRGAGDGLHHAIFDAHLKINNLKELFGPAISTAVKNPGRNFAELQGGLNLHDVAHAFEQGVIPKCGGKNSKSGAAFFYSSDKTYIAKRIRDVEYNDALVNMMAGGKYRHHVKEGSILCPTYLAFQSGGDSWIVMRTEQFTAKMRALVPTDIAPPHEFFADIKPHPLTSDRVSMLKEMRSEFLRTQFSLERLDGWHRMLRIFSSDLDFLEQHRIVDYSLWVYGTLFDMPNEAKAQKWKSEFVTALAEANRPGCVFGCQPSLNRPLADLTKLMGFENRVRSNGRKYKCCCVDLSPGDIGEALSPCVLKSVDATPVRSGFNKAGCRSLVGKDWYSFWHMSTHAKNPTLKNRCLVTLGVVGGVGREIPGDSVGFPEVKRWPSDVLAPESLGISYNAISPAWRCGVVCVSIGDYFLRFGAWEKFENAALILWYRALKWTNYRSKIMSLMEEVAKPTFEGREPVGDFLFSQVVRVIPNKSRETQRREHSELGPRAPVATPILWGPGDLVPFFPLGI